MRNRTLAALALLALIAPLAAMTNTPTMPDILSSAKTVSSPIVGPVSILTYNVKGLPWPVATGRTSAFEAIERRLNGLRAVGEQPHVVVLQEAFTDRAKQIGVRSGYAFRATGPAAGDPVADDPPGEGAEFLNNASALKGETEGKWLDSGLMIFSDYPIISIKRAAFSKAGCAGYDCLANKGILMVELRVPGQDVPVTVVTTHLNSKKGAGVSQGRSLEAYRRQVAALSSYMRTYRNPDSPFILAGDLNASSPARRQVLTDARLAAEASPGPLQSRSGLDAIQFQGKLANQLAAEANYISKRGRDWQFFGDGRNASVRPSDLQIPFGNEADGSMLSDHLGFSISYRLTRKV